MFIEAPFRMGTHAVIPFHVDLVKIRRLDPSSIRLIIAASQDTEIQCAMKIALYGIRTILAHGEIDPDITQEIDANVDQMVIAARNGLEANIRVSANNVERLAMIMQTWQTDPDLLIEEAKQSVLANDMVIEAWNGADLIPSIQLEEINNDLILRIAGGIEIDIGKALENINNTMELDLQRRVMKIKVMDPQETGVLDEQIVGMKKEIPFELALEIGVLEDDSGVMNLVLYARNGVETILTHPIVIGTIDPKKLGELDPYFIPDATAETT